MGKVLRAVSMFLLLAMVLAFAGSAEAGQIMVTNGTGFALHQIYISDSGTEDWEEDLLGNQILEDGETLRVPVDGAFTKFDLAAVDEDGDSVAWYGIPGGASSVTIYADGTAEYE